MVFPLEIKNLFDGISEKYYFVAEEDISLLFLELVLESLFVNGLLDC